MRGRSSILLVLSLFLAVTAACGSPSVPVEQGGGAVMTEPHEDALYASGWLEFANLSLHTDAESAEPNEPYIRGRVLGGYFTPTGEIVGPKERPGGRRGRFLLKGWLDLHTRRFYEEQSGEPPAPPYVEGVKDRDSGGFYPTADIVHGQG